MVTKIGIDLGYANITLSNAIADIYREPSVVLVDKATRRILAVGAKAALGNDGDIPDSGILIRPFKNGLLSITVKIEVPEEQKRKTFEIK